MSLSCRSSLVARRIRSGAFLVVTLLLLVPHSAAFAGTSAATPELRRDIALGYSIARPGNEGGCGTEAEAEQRCIWFDLSRGLDELFLARSQTEVFQGNGAVREAMPLIMARIAADSGVQAELPTYFHFLTAGLLSRVYFTFADRSTLFPGRLAADNSRAIEEAFYSYARHQCRLADADPAHPWRFWFSENHSAMHDGACWEAAEILSQHPPCGACQYDDGSTPATEKSAWNAFLIAYIRERATHGGFVEIFSPYYRYTLQNFYNYADFSDDPKLKRFAASLLDIWWTDWAQEEIDGKDGGSKARINVGDVGRRLVGSEPAWLYFGNGANMPASIVAPQFAIMLTSSYRPPTVASDLVSQSRTARPVVSRRPGLLAQPPQGMKSELDGQRGGILRYTYVSPSFVMGTSIIPKLPDASWAQFSSQNRWNGVMLSGGAQRFLFARPLFLSDKTKSYNDSWGVQHLGTQIIQKLPKPLSKNAGQMAVWVGSDLQVEREGDWAFVASSAYVAFRPAFGGFADVRTFGEASGPRSGGAEGDDAPAEHEGQVGIRQYVVNADEAPVIIQTAEKSQFADFADFKRAVLNCPLTVSSTDVVFQGLGSSGKIVFHYNSDQLPEVDGTPINLAPPYEFDSPYIVATWGQPLVTLQDGADKKVLDFR